MSVYTRLSVPLFGCVLLSVYLALSLCPCACLLGCWAVSVSAYTSCLAGCWGDSVSVYKSCLADCWGVYVSAYKSCLAGCWAVSVSACLYVASWWPVSVCICLLKNFQYEMRCLAGCGLSLFLLIKVVWLWLADGLFTKVAWLAV